MLRLLALLLVLVASAAARAEDVVLLKNGREVRGKVVEERADAVKIDIGGGKITFRRDQIQEVRRQGTIEGATADPSSLGTEPATRREEHALLYLDGERCGTRTLRSTKLPDGWLFEEEVRLLDKEGAVRREVRTTERDDLQLRPLSFQVRETEAEAHRTLSGEVRGGRVHLVEVKEGDKQRREVAAPEDLRFPFAARELFLRETRALSAQLDTPALDLATGVPCDLAYREGGTRPLRLEERSLVARVVVRRFGDRLEREWIAPDGTAVLSELRGAGTLAIATTRQAIERLRGGDVERVTGPDSAARTRYADKARGWRVEKPDPTWTFEKPQTEGVGALLVVRNEPLFASVDLMTDPDASPRVRAEDAAEALQRVCRAVAPDFRVLRDGWVDRGGVRVYWMEATATTKGEATHTLARVVVHGGKVYRLLAACPEAAFETLRADLEKVLDSFRVE
jgi:hypothetical protein